MADADPYQLRGTYHAPPVRVGQVVRCRMRGRVRVTGFTAARIPWPVGSTGAGRHTLVVYGGLLRALRKETTGAVGRWWGVSPTTVDIWRRALGIARPPGRPPKQGRRKK
jgi:hypothetical protein